MVDAGSGTEMAARLTSAANDLPAVIRIINGESCVVPNQIADEAKAAGKLFSTPFHTQRKPSRNLAAILASILS